MKFCYYVWKNKTISFFTSTKQGYYLKLNKNNQVFSESDNNVPGVNSIIYLIS